MTWVRIDDGYFTNPKAIAAGPNGRALHLASICWASANLSDGHVPRQVLPVLAAIAGVKAAPASSALIDAGLWADTPDGWQIKDYLEFNPSAEKVKADRAAAAERQRNARDAAAKRKHGHADVTDMSHRDKAVSHAPKTDDRQTTPPDVSKSPDDDDYAVPPAESSSSFELTLGLLVDALAIRASKASHGGWKNSTKRLQRAENGTEIAQALANGDDPIEIANRYCDPVHVRIAARNRGLL